jgi:hypothetical protein
MVTFRKKAHAISECLGNKSLFSLHECDECNEKFGRHLEDHLAKYLLPMNAISQVKGKRGVPAYKSPSKKSRIGLANIITTEDDNLFDINQERKEMVFKLKRQPYIPLAVFKSLTKSALTVMPIEKLDYYRDALRWIYNLDHKNDPCLYKPLKLFLSFTPGALPFAVPKVMLFFRKDDKLDVPFGVFVIGSGNIIFQIFIPYCSRDTPLSGKELLLAHFPSPVGSAWEYGTPSYMIDDLTSNEIVRGQEFAVSLHYESISIIPNL